MMDNTGVETSQRWPDRVLTPSAIQSYAASFQNAKPFPHLVVDGLFPEPVLRNVSRSFVTADPAIWTEFTGPLHRKLATQPGVSIPAAVQEYFDAINSSAFLRQLSQITGIGNLIADPDLYGGGMHEVRADGRFDVHLDFVLHPRTRLTNRLVVITYLNAVWEPADGGALELWDVETSTCNKLIPPVFGRTVILEQSSRSVHGHPVPIREGYQRRSVIAYFYTDGSADQRGGKLETVYVTHKGMRPRKRLEIFFHRTIPKSLRSTAKAIYRRFY